MKTKTTNLLAGLLGGTAALATLLISTPSRAQEPRGDRELRSSGEFGAYFGIVPGVVGNARNPGLEVTPGLSLAVGRTVRYHLTFGYAHMFLNVGNGVTAGINGIDLRPATLGIPIHIQSWEDVGLAIEPLIDVFGMQGYFGGGAALFLFSSGFGAQAVVNFRQAYISFAPINLQFQYLLVGSAPGGSLAGTGFGLNMPVRLSGGLRF